MVDFDCSQGGKDFQVQSLREKQGVAREGGGVGVEGVHDLLVFSNLNFYS